MRCFRLAPLAGALLVQSVSCSHASDGEVHAKPHRPHHHGHDPAAAGHQQPTSNHRFDDAEAWAQHFEDPERDAWQKPDAVLDAMQLEPTSLVADIGAATGYFPVRIAKRVPQGKVWGADVEADMVRYLGERAQREGLENLSAVLATAVDAKLPEPVDRILMVNTYHHIGDRVAYFTALADRLRPGGKLVIVDFKAGELPVGPPPDHKLAPAVIVDELKAAGYVVEARYDEMLPYQVVLVLRRAP